MTTSEVAVAQPTVITRELAVLIAQQLEKLHPTAEQITLGPQDDWEPWAACRKMGLDKFDPVGANGKIDNRRVDAARKVCRTCSVLWPCIKDAFETKDESMVRASTTPRQRGNMAGVAQRNDQGE